MHACLRPCLAYCICAKRSQFRPRRESHPAIHELASFRRTGSKSDKTAWDSGRTVNAVACLHRRRFERSVGCIKTENSSGVIRPASAAPDDRPSSAAHPEGSEKAVGGRRQTEGTDDAATAVGWTASTICLWISKSISSADSSKNRTTETQSTPRYKPVKTRDISVPRPQAGVCRLGASSMVFQSPGHAECRML